MQLALLVFVSGLLASQAGAVSLGQRTALRGLLTRQSNPLETIPAVCEARCNSITDTVQNCQQPSCFCSTANARLLKDCLDCVVGLFPSPDIIATGQEVLDQFGDVCGGFSIPRQTISLPLSTSSTSRTPDPTPPTIPTPSASPTITPDPSPLTTTQIVQTTVTTVLKPEPESSGGETLDSLKNGARGLAGGVAALVVGLFTGVVIALV
ncbi:hypothetical protein D9615_008603 [Tricholomella constricta]|uniref:Extracellular membrane protein CFEM domain-containing protein n=1 Tax=Tricholomella constricta TaxID=117010 RepID=A0A8H5M0L2_9AGAR|nr:hypothetical protein D9615_008603 [Tricholomella constricta]